MIYFIHGYQSSPQGTTGTNFSEVMSKLGEEFVMVSYDYSSDPDKIHREIQTQLIEGPAPSIIVGHSFGGFWARYFANLYGVTLVMFNPALDAVERFTAMEATVKPHHLRAYDFKQDHVPVYVGLGACDDVVLPDMALDMYTNYGYVELDKNGSHRPSKKLMEKVITNALRNPPIY